METKKVIISAYMAEIGAKGGAVKSERKAASSAENGKKGGRPATAIYKKNIIVDERKRLGRVTGWWLSYTYPDGRTVKNYYQNGFYDLKRAKHVFFKSCVEPRQNG